MMDKQKNSLDTIWKNTSVMETSRDQTNLERKMLIKDIKGEAQMMKWNSKTLMMILIEMVILCHCKSLMDG